MDIVYQKNAEILVFLWASDHVKNGKLFQNVIKVNTFAYAHINIKYFDFSNDFYIFSRKVTLELALSIHPVLFLRDAFSKRQNQASNNLIFFFLPKVLRIFFTPKNTSQGQKLKPFRITIFFGTPCIISGYFITWVISTISNTIKLSILLNVKQYEL